MINEPLISVSIPERLPTIANARIKGFEIAQACREGLSDTLETITQLKAIIEAANTAIEELKPDALSEIAKHGKEGASVLSAKLQEMEAGVKYDYSGCPIWRELDKTVKTAEADRKDREAFLKTLKKPIKELDESTGEMIEVNPPIKTSTTTLKITLAKE